ncbi:hypothetical protein AgCh_009218 [Apium graveolens]
MDFTNEGPPCQVKLSETKSYLETAKGKITKLTEKLSEQQLLIQKLEDDIFKVLKQLNMLINTQISLIDKHRDIDMSKRPWEFLTTGHKIGTPVPLFKELSDKDVEYFWTKFAGSQADRIVKAEAETKQISEQLKKAKISSYISKDGQRTNDGASTKEGKAGLWKPFNFLTEVINRSKSSKSTSQKEQTSKSEPANGPKIKGLF